MADPGTDGPGDGQPAAGTTTAPAPAPAAPPRAGTILTRGAAPASGASPAPSPAPAGNGTPPGQGAPDAPPAGDWRADFTDPELKTSRVLDKFTGKEALAKSYIELQQLIAPGNDAKPEVLERWRKHIGVPADPTGYVLPDPPSGTRDGATLTLAQQHFRDAGLMPWQAAKMAALFDTVESHREDLLRSEYAKGVDSLEQEWGAERFAQQTTLAARAIAFLDDQETEPAKRLAPWLDQTGHGDHPVLIRTLAKIGDMLEEHRLIDPQLPGMPGKTEAQAELDRINADPKHPAHNPDDPGHLAAFARKEGLYKLIHGTREVVQR